MARAAYKDARTDKVKPAVMATIGAVVGNQSYAGWIRTGANLLLDYLYLFIFYTDEMFAGRTKV